MPAINVARTDTFEQQRVKINEIGTQIFNVTAGGSDLATGNLKLGDGTVAIPSLAFTNEPELGIIRPTNNTIQYVSDGKKLLNIASSSTTFFKDVILQKNGLSTQGVFIVSGGQNYEGGTYTNVEIVGGTGTGALSSITVENFGGSITTDGEGYLQGNFSNVNMVGGSGAGTTVTFSVDGIANGTVTPGSGYTDGVYSGVNLIGGNGNGAVAEIVVITGAVNTVSFSNEGSGYQNGDILTANTADIGGTGNGFNYEITTNPGIIDELIFQIKEAGYVVGEVLSLPTGVSGISVTLPGEVSGVSTTLNNASAQITVASTTGIVVGMSVTQDPGDVGIIDPTATVQSIDSATELTLTSAPLVSGAASLTFTSPNPQQLTVPNSNVFNQGDILTVTSGTGQFAANTSVSIIIDATTIFLSEIPTSAGPAVISTSPPYGVGSTPLQYTIDAVGTVGEVIITDAGNGYSVGDSLTVDPTNLLQTITYQVSSQTTERVTFSPAVPAGVFQVGQQVQNQLSTGITSEVYEVVLNGGNIDYIIIGSLGLNQSDVLEVSTNTSLNGTVDVSEQKNKYFIDLDDGNGALYRPSLTLYPGNTYRFNYPSGHPFGFSRSRDGKWDPGNITNISATVDVTTKTVTVSSTTGILEGMLVSEVGIGAGEIETDTVVESVVDATTITLSKLPVNPGSMTLEFTGSEYTDGITREGNSNYIIFKVNESTPSTLYYYCFLHPDMAGEDGLESTVSIAASNPRLIGSGLSIGVSQVTVENIITINNDAGSITCVDLTSTGATIDSATITSLQSSSLTATTFNATTISASTLTISSQTTNISGDVNVGSTITANSVSGEITTSGILRTNDKLNVNNIGFIEDNEFYVTNGNLVLRPPALNVAKIDSSTALVIPAGATVDRPTTLAQNGSIRFNTTTEQYEGYNATTTSWSSLGGVRDIDGNTYILAELTTGANDNTLWFYNDNANTLKLTPEFLDFRNVKKISSGKLGLPAFSVWSSNTPVSVGQYLKYKNNLYEVTGAGTTATSGSEPTHTSGVVNNGTAQLTWYSSSVSPLEFTEVEELRVGPNKDCPLIISQETKILDNVISTLVQDLVLTPNSGKKVSIDAPTSLVIPVGNTNQRGSASQGSIRYNTSISQFEGYSGSNWSSLGGVRDVDGNTYIIPETAPAANENILYFYNNNVNTIKLSETELDFTNIDTITTSGGNSLALNTDILTLDSSATTIDNTRADTTFISTSKQYFDLGLSSGLNVDPVLRLDDQGDVYLNTGFGTGTFNGVKIFDGDLKDFELADYAVATKTFQLTKGSTNNSSAILYSIASAKGCDVTVISKSSSGKKSMAKYSVIDDGTDIYFIEIGSLNTSADGFTTSFDITALNETRISLTLSDDHSNGDVVSFTLVTQTIK
jgi:hypothetical protein